MPTVRRGCVLPPRSLKPPPEYIWVQSHEMPEAAGRFILQKDVRNDMPTWKAGVRYLYCNNGGGWMLASDYEHMETNRGWIASARPHSNQYPDEHTAWEAADGQGGWLTLASVKLTSSPPPLPQAVAVNCLAHPEVSGLYTLIPDVYHNGFSVWGCNDKRLYSGEGGWWLVDPDKKHMELDRGLLASAEKHGGRMPTEMTHWEVADGTGGWAHEEQCTVAQVSKGPGALQISAPPTPNTSFGSMQPPLSLQYTPSHPSSGSSIKAESIAEITALAEEVGMLRHVVHTKELRITSFEEELRDLNNLSEEKELRLLNEIKLIRDQLSEVRANKDLLQTQLDNSELQQGRLRCEILDFKAKVKSLEDANKKLEASLEKATQEKNETATELHVAKGQITSLDEELVTQKAANKKAEADIEHLTDKVCNLEEEFEAAQQLTAAQEETLKESQKTIEEQAAQILEVRDKVHNTTQDNEGLAATIKSLQEDCIEHQGTVAARDERCAALTQKLGECTRELQDMCALSTALKHDVKACFKLVHKQRRVLCRYTKVNKALATENTDLQAELDFANDKTATLDKLTANQATCLSQLEEVKQELTANGNHLTNENESLRRKVKELEGALETEVLGHKQHFDAARRAAEATVQAAADSLLSLIGEGRGGESMSPGRNPALQRAKDSLAGWAP